MTASNTPPGKRTSAAPTSRLFSLEEAVSLLPEGVPRPSDGRIRTLAHARRALGLPTSADPAGLALWGSPSDFQLAVYPVSDPDQPTLVAEFAVLRVLTRHGRRLTPAHRHARLPVRDRSNLWVVYGSIAQLPAGTLIIETLALGPAFPDHHAHTQIAPSRGITADLLRLTSSQRLLSAAIEQLQRQGHWLNLAHQHGAPPMSKKQRDLLHRLDRARTRDSTVTDEQLADLAKRYLVLHLRGQHHPLPQLAAEFGITRTQARDRIHKARRRNYLTKGQQGRAGANPGPRLKKLGWNPPVPPVSHPPFPPSSA